MPPQYLPGWNRQAPASPKYGPASVPQEILDAIKLLPDRSPVVLSYEVVNTDRNIGTRLSGRIAEIHGEMVVALPIKRTQDIAKIRALIELDLEKTGNVQATKLLSNCEKTTLKLVRVIAKERAELEAAEELHEAASTPVGAK